MLICDCCDRAYHVDCLREAVLHPSSTSPASSASSVSAGESKAAQKDGKDAKDSSSNSADSSSADLDLTAEQPVPSLAHGPFNLARSSRAANAPLPSLANRACLVDQVPETAWHCADCVSMCFRHLRALTFNWLLAQAAFRSDGFS